MTAMTRLPQTQAQLLKAAADKQASAANPAVSAWVRANAGTGKTHVLVQRILRLLLSGAEPRAILCLTFTKNAAAEMEDRVLKTLGEWVTASGPDLETRLSLLLSRAPSEAEMAAARCLFASVIDAPGGLAIMTIHGFCERVLRRYSLEANVPPGFTVLTEEEASSALSEAASMAFANATTETSLGHALTTIVAHASQEQFGRVLEAMLCKRNHLAALFRVLGEDAGSEIEARLRKVFGVDPADTHDTLLQAAGSVLDRKTLAELTALLRTGTKSDIDSMSRFQAVLNATAPDQACDAMRDALLTKEGEPRKSLMTGALKKREPIIVEQLVAAQGLFARVQDKLCALKAIEATVALVRLIERIFEHYANAKRARGAVDFDDLIAATLNLLAREDAAAWVLYELDGRIDHILIDEAQDTSPEQWSILERLTSDFFAGESARDCIPTVFAVGDEKQSIYGFQGASPEYLAHHGGVYEESVTNAGFEWRSVNLDLSFRTLDPILAAVDSVCRVLPDVAEGNGLPHLAYRVDEGGLVEMWEPERGSPVEKGTAWEPSSDEVPAPKPAEMLAKRIASQIRHWLDTGEGLSSLGRAITPGDILILLRKRVPMAKLLQKALRAEKIPVAGADRIALADEIAAMDLLALADALLQRDDDLALAVVLKGPLFGFDEDALFALSHGRTGSLWSALEEHASRGDASAAAAATKLVAWRNLAIDMTPFDFYAHILDGEQGRELFARRIGPDCLDAVDEFLSLAATFDDRGHGDLGEFAAFVRTSATEVKRETDQASREVRIMTVHGAKGLEAPIVILADTCSNRSASPPAVFFLDDGTEAPALPVWAVKGAAQLKPIAEAKDREKEAAERELGRLLYVAMTRARDRLYIAGFHNNSLPSGCWYETIKTALAPNLEEAVDFEGRAVFRSGSKVEWKAPSPVAAEPPQKVAPPWASLAPKPEKTLRVVSPSDAAARAFDTVSVSGKGGDVFDRDSTKALGTLTHKLLEILPEVERNHRGTAADLIASTFSQALPSHLRRKAVEDVMNILASTDWPATEALSEVGLAVEAGVEGGGDRVVISGQADRVLLGADGVVVVDYKSGALAESPDVAAQHAAQVACYRLALQRIYAGRPITAQVYSTRTRASLQADDATLDASLQAVLARVLKNESSETGSGL